MADEAQAAGIWIFGGSDDTVPVVVGAAEPRRTAHFSPERTSALIKVDRTRQYIAAVEDMTQRGA